MQKLLATLLLAGSGLMLAAPPQATPAQCTPESQTVEACLQKAGLRNFSRDQDVLTVPLAGGKRARFVSGDAGTPGNFYYGGYQVESALHLLIYLGRGLMPDEYDTSRVYLLQHQSGQQAHYDIELFSGSLSTDRQWLLGVESLRNCDPSCENPLRLLRLKSTNQHTLAQAQTLPDNMVYCRSGQHVLAERAHWQSHRVRIDWRCSQGNQIFNDQTTLSFDGARWRSDRRACAPR